MISIVFNFKKKIGIYNENDSSKTFKIEVREPSSLWKTASFAFDKGEKRVSVSWKMWNNTHQIVELHEFDGESSVPAKWSYISDSLNSSDIQNDQSFYFITIVGSAHGDWHM